MHGHVSPVGAQRVLAKGSRGVIQSSRWRGKGPRAVRQDELVAAHVRALIEAGLRKGELRPGDKVPFTQAELAERLGVNRNSVYWGLAALRAEGLIIGVQGGRAVIARRGLGRGDDDAGDASAGGDDAQDLTGEL